MTNAKDLTVVITHRCADRYRDRNLEVVLKHLKALNCTQTLVVEQDAHRRLPDSGTLDESVEHVFAFNPGGFNRSWGFNIGANLARGKTILFLDGDLIVPRWALEAALDACENGADAVNPYSRLVELSEADSRRFCNEIDTTEAPSINGWERSEHGEHISFCGGAYFINARFYRDIGGQDERFRGWGGEDDAMSIKVLSLAKRVFSLTESVAFHLYHPRARDALEWGSQYRRNVELLQAYRGGKMDFHSMGGANRNGRIDKYRAGHKQN